MFLPEVAILFSKYFPVGLFEFFHSLFFGQTALFNTNIFSYPFFFGNLPRL